VLLLSRCVSRHIIDCALRLTTNVASRQGNISNTGVLSIVLRPLADPTVTSQGLRVSLESKEIDLLFWKTQAFQNPSLICSAIMRDEPQYHRNLPASLNIIDAACKVMWRLHYTPFAEEKVHIKHSALSLIYQPLDALLPIPASHTFRIFSAYSCVAQNNGSSVSGKDLFTTASYLSLLLILQVQFYWLLLRHPLVKVPSSPSSAWWVGPCLSSWL
jgi:hypothetical protein